MRGKELCMSFGYAWIAAELSNSAVNSGAVSLAAE
jgi:hypothetical protein